MMAHVPYELAVSSLPATLPASTSPALGCTRNSLPPAGTLPVSLVTMHLLPTHEPTCQPCAGFGWPQGRRRRRVRQWMSAPHAKLFWRGCLRCLLVAQMVPNPCHSKAEAMQSASTATHGCAGIGGVCVIG